MSSSDLLPTNNPIPSDRELAPSELQQAVRGLYEIVARHETALRGAAPSSAGSLANVVNHIHDFCSRWGMTPYAEPAKNDKPQAG